MGFTVDSRILSTSAWIGDGTLSSVYIKNDKNFLWFVLVPHVEQVTEIFHLSVTQRNILMEEIAKLSRIINDYQKPDKLNIGALGNIVSQLHIHIVARIHGDEAWPHSVWQPNCNTVPYADAELDRLVTYWRTRFDLS